MSLSHNVVKTKILFFEKVFLTRILMLDSSEILSLYAPLSEIEEIHWANNVILSLEKTPRTNFVRAANPAR
jgi:hypothetical protein